MRIDGQPVDGFLVLPGVEVTTADGHLLCIGAELPFLKGKPAREVCEIIHQRGGLAIPPHPYDLFRAGIRFRFWKRCRWMRSRFSNAATTLRRYNRYAFKYAQVRNLPMVAASDAHHAAAVGTAYTILNTDDFSVKGILAPILKSNELNQRYLTPRDSLRKPGITGCDSAAAKKSRARGQRSPAPSGKRRAVIGENLRNLRIISDSSFLGSCFPD